MKFFSPYRMPGYIPPHLRGKTYGPAVTRRGVRFIGNATGNVNVVSSKGKRYTPRTLGSPVGKKKTLKAVRKVTPNVLPLWTPSYAMRKAAPKFAKAVLEHLGLKEWQQVPKGKGKRQKTKKKRDQ